MATKTTSISTEASNPTAKSPRQKITEEILPKVNPDVPLRPVTNNDPNKPVDAKTIAPVAAANSNHGIQVPPASAVPAQKYGAGITEPKTPGAVDPTSPAYAQQQQARYQQLMKSGPTIQDRLIMAGLDNEAIPVGRVGGLTVGTPAPAAPTAQATPSPSSPFSRAAFTDYMQKTNPDNLSVFNSMPEERQKAIFSKWVESEKRKSGPMAAPVSPAPAGPVASAGFMSPLPSSNVPIPTATGLTPSSDRDTKMMEVLRNPKADPQAREQASTYMKVKTMYNQRGKFKREIGNLERAGRAYVRQLGNMFKNNLNRRDPKYQQQYDHWRALRKGDPQAKLIMYNELLKRPEFASLNYK